MPRAQRPAPISALPPLRAVVVAIGSQYMLLPRVPFLPLGVHRIAARSMRSHRLVLFPNAAKGGLIL